MDSVPISRSVVIAYYLEPITYFPDTLCLKRSCQDCESLLQNRAINRVVPTRPRSSLQLRLSPSPQLARLSI